MTTRPIVVSRWQWLRDVLKGAIVTFLGVVCFAGFGLYFGRLQYVPKGDWFVTKNSCVPNRTLNDTEEKLWTDACVALWRVGKSN